VSLERKDVRCKLDAEWHEALLAVCDRDRLDIGEFVEGLLVRELGARIHAAILDADSLLRLGITGKIRQGLKQPEGTPT